MHDTDPHPPLGDAPPTVPGQVADNRPTQWPTLLGVIAIVFGSAGALGGLWGMVFPLLLDLILPLIPDEEAKAQFAAQAQHAAGIISMSLIMLLLAVLLLFCGIGVMRRQARAIAWLRHWALLKIVFAVVWSVLGLILQQQQIAQMQSQTAGGMPATVQSMQNALMIFGVLFNIAWGWALPIFVLIWTGREAIRQQVETWN